MLILGLLVAAFDSGHYNERGVWIWNAGLIARLVRHRAQRLKLKHRATDADWYATLKRVILLEARIQRLEAILLT